MKEVTCQREFLIGLLWMSMIKGGSFLKGARVEEAQQ